MSTQAPARRSDAGDIDSAVPDVEAVALHRSYGDVVAVDGVDLAIAQGEFFTLLGPVWIAQRLTREATGVGGTPAAAVGARQ